MSDARRTIPSVERLLSSPALAPILAVESRIRVTALLRAIQNEVRSGASLAASEDAWYAEQLADRLAKAGTYSLQSVINATGVVLHTNLGRAPLAAVAIDAIVQTAGGYANLEYDLATGERGSRYTHCADLLCTLTGAESALVVNNNAAALVLMLNTIAMGRGVVISRGELVEIGDTFRIAEIAARSGAELAEVGATNRTHAADYSSGLASAAAVLKVHPSNFRATGFVSEVTARELAPLARAAGVPLLHDLGSGLIESLEDLGLPREVTAREALAEGADVVTMSGDKLLGGPQAGIILGKKALIDAMKRNPLCRALRVDKLTIAALEATLQCYARGKAREEIPILRMIAASSEELATRAQRIAGLLQQAHVECAVVDGASTVGGGAYPDVVLPTRLITIASAQTSSVEVEQRLRCGRPPVVARIAGGRVVIDVRTVLPEQESALIAVVADVV